MSRRSNVAGYLISGATAAAANYGSRFMFSHWVPFEAAVVMAYGVGMACAFVLMRRYAFPGATRPLAVQAGAFAAVNAVALLQTVVVSSLLARWLLPLVGVESAREAIAHAVGVAVPVVTSYFGHRLVTFR